MATVEVGTSAPRSDLSIGEPNDSQESQTNFQQLLSEAAVNLSKKRARVWREGGNKYCFRAEIYILCDTYQSFVN